MWQTNQRSDLQKPNRCQLWILSQAVEGNNKKRNSNNKEKKIKMSDFKNKKVLEIKKEETYDWLKRLHYAKRIPSISYSFGLYLHKELIGVITYGSPPSSSLCIGICGEQFKDKVIEAQQIMFN